MPPRRPLILICVLLALSAVPARPVPQTSFEWPPIDPEELSLKDDPANPRAPAMILALETNEDHRKCVLTRYSRIKVFNDRGKKYGDVEIPYYGKEQEIFDVRARTIRPNGTIVPFAGEIYERMAYKVGKVQVRVKTFALPDVGPGSIVEYSYRVRWKEDFPDPLKHPSSYIIDRAIALPTTHWVIQEDVSIRRARYSFVPLASAPVQWVSLGLRKGEAPEQQPDGSFVLEVRDMPPFREEAYAPPEDTLKPRVDFYYTLGYFGGHQQFWSDYGRERAAEVEAFVGKLDPLQKEVARIVSPRDSAEAKLRKIYARVQKIRYLSYERSRTEKEVKRENLDPNKSVRDVLAHNYANGNEINYVFAGLARAANLEAAVVLVAGRDRRFFLPQFLDASQLSHLVVLVRDGPKSYFLDPATRFCPFGLLPWEETGTRGLRLYPSGGELTDIPMPKSEEAVVSRKGQFRLQQDGALTGKLQIEFMGQQALSRRLQIYNEDAASKRREMKDTVEDWLPFGARVENLVIANLADSEEPLRVECDVIIPAFAIRTARRLLLPVAVLRTSRRHPFEHVGRVHPVYFRYPFREADDIVIDLPAGYRLEVAPRPRKEENSYSRFELSSAAEGSRLRLQRLFGIEGFFFATEYYGVVRAFYNRVRIADEERVVLHLAETAKN